ncbi:N-formylglutamate deformylase [Maritalea mediterranea]|uniref:N-formylglutamate deformylase n=1 Tax=Maritalea mediterranea TaxID=2909667 RepID=A0ABS9E4E0_9HYPH|nr:N-formylglutamate deformylase [Maritalea mediterranea]MCF4097057.1 N-formylglutamate deformylase [Maritalea mediterranea]
MEPFTLTKGDSPLILAFPHVGTFVPADIAGRLNERGMALVDTDWFIDEVYADLMPGATTIRATFSRYVIDANRDPEGVSLYPGQNTTTLCPTIDFEGQPIYHEGQAPTPGEIEARRIAFHAPYHAAIRDEIARIKAKHGYAVLYDGHSIRSELPFLFEGTLPALNLGTNGGATVLSDMEKRAFDIARDSAFESVLNGRFKGGWTTRHYGQPDQNVYAFQMEIAQSAYLKTEQAPWALDVEKCARLRPTLKLILDALLDEAARVHVA